MAEIKRDRLIKYIDGAVYLLLSGLGACGICHVMELAGFQNAAFTAFGVVIMAAVRVMLQRTRQDLALLQDKRARSRRIIFAAAVSFLFSVSMIMGYQLQDSGMTAGGFKGKGLILFWGACLAIAVFPAGNFLFRCVERIGRGGAETEGRQVRPGILFGVCVAVTFLCLIPVWLAYYPIIMSYDFHRQINEAAKGFAWFYPYQPIAHTWVIWVFLQIGELCGSIQTGMACMALFQMLLYALVTAYAVVTVYRTVKRVWPAVIALLFFAVFPFNTVMVVCTTKDVLFTILFLLFFLLFVERGFFSFGRKRLVMDVLLVLEGCLMVQFRNNAFHALAVFLVLFLLCVPRREKLEALLLCLLLIAGGKGGQFVIREAIGTQIGAAKTDMYSVPIQQFARIGFIHGEELDEETAELLDSYVPREYWQNYYPPLADSVKIFVDSDSFSKDTGRFLGDWVRLGLKYPNEYIDAFLELTRGYWFPDDVSWAENLGSGEEGRMGAVFTYNSSEIENVGSIEHESKLPWLERQLEKIVSCNSFYDWPVVSLIFRSSFFTWSLFLVMAAYWYLGRKRQFLAGCFPFLYTATMLLGPVVQLRYLFPAMCVLPVMLALLCGGAGEACRDAG